MLWFLWGHNNGGVDWLKVLSPVMTHTACHSNVPFWSSPRTRNSEFRSDDEDDTSAGIPSPNIHTTPEAGR
ncbi:hypothetical protein AVEN_87979-1 [Araneus ventricosus]|uniref:Uncharacterized protein n=1 Tax=Araneus ventricosus TaxID=182803 RepID=A0A4Y2WS96_ARAVE|nr:hypothetical protein AVEN_85513-1 [Araneus ventricosus]GBO39494.1 hypothetical protein AVEN_87979-1 [Araneus ventricosus]